MKIVDMQKDPEEAKRVIAEWERHEQAAMDGTLEEEPEAVTTFIMDLKERADWDILLWLDIHKEDPAEALKALIREDLEQLDFEEADTEPDSFEDWGYTPADD